MAGCVGEAALLPLHCGAALQCSGPALARGTPQLKTATVSQAPRTLVKTAQHRHMCVADFPPTIHGLRPSAHPNSLGSVSFRSGQGVQLASSQSPFLSKLRVNGSEFVSQRGRRGLTVQATVARPRPAGTTSPARRQTSGGGGSNSNSSNNNARRSLPPVNRQQQQEPRSADRGSRPGGEPRRANPPGPAGNGSSNSSGNSGLRRGRSRTVASRRTQPLVTRPKVIGEAGFLPNRLASDPFGGPGMQPMEQLELERGVCKPFKKYSPERVRARALSSPDEFVKVGLRGVEIVWSLSMYWLSLWVDKVQGREDEMMPLRAAQLRNLLCDLGPSFIKAGQVLANRPDIIREDYMNELCILQDDVPAFPSKIAFEMMDEELGQPLEEVFSEISPEPVAAASLGQVYRARLRANGAEVAIKVQRPGVEPVIYRDLFLFRTLASFLNGISIQKLGCNAELIVDEFGEKLLDELDYQEEARNIQSFYENFSDDNTVKIPYCYRELCGTRCLVMEWIDGIRCTDPQAIRDAGIDIDLFITTGVSAALRQLLEFGLFHGDPHPGNIFAMRDGRIAYVDFGNVAELSQYNKEILIDAIVHAVNEDYVEMAGDFTRLGFLAPGTDVTPIVPALEAIWQNSTGQSLADFNFRTVTTKFNELVYNYPIRIPERFSLVIRSLLTQEGICLTLEPNFKFLEVAYPYVAKRLLTDPDPALRSRLIQVLFKDGVFQWKRLENLIVLAREQVAMANRARVNTSAIGNGAASGSARIGATGRQLQRTIAVTTGSSSASSSSSSSSSGGLDLRDTLQDGARLLVLDEALRRQLLMAFTQDSRLHVQEVMDIYRLVSDDIPPESLVVDFIGGIPRLGRDILLSWSDAVLAKR